MVGPSPHILIGKRARTVANPQQVLEQADDGLAALGKLRPSHTEDFRALKMRHAAICRTYYSVAALSRRKVLDEELRRQAYSKLFIIRSALEQAIIADMGACGLREDLVDAWASRSFFGVSAKQGVSIRYALASCVPTYTCGSKCYAHDGRDREIHHIFRGALNFSRRIPVRIS